MRYPQRGRATKNLRFKFAGSECRTTTCDKWDNVKSINSIDSSQASISHGVKTDSDLARPPGGDHPAAQQASPGVLTRSVAPRAIGRTCAPVTRSEANHGSKMIELEAERCSLDSL